MIKSFKRFMNQHYWFRRSLKANRELKETLIKELQKCKERKFTGSDWTEEAYQKFEQFLIYEIKDLDDMRIKAINHGV